MDKAGHYCRLSARHRAVPFVNPLLSQSETSESMSHILSWWNSYQTLSTLGTILKFSGATIGLLILVFGFRESSLRSRAQAEERANVAKRIASAEASTKPRKLSPEQKELLIASLKALAQKPKVFLSAGLFDAEAMAFGEEIEGALIASGFEVHFPKEFTADAAMMVGPPGLHLVLKDRTAPNPLAVTIQKAFIAAGLKLFALDSSDSNFPADKIEITIGQR